MKAILAGLVGAILVVSAFSAPTFAQATVACEQDYTITAGDWLSKIAEKFLGSASAYPAIVTQTNLKSETDLSFATVVNPDSVEVGWKLCIPNADTAKALNGDNAPAGLERAALYNATYSSELVPEGKVTVKDGKFSAPAAPNTPLMTTLDLTGQIAYGDLNGTPSAAVVTGSSGGGSGFFYIISLMQVQDGKPVEVATTSSGDRSPVLAIVIADNQLKLDYITQGPDQPMCCGNLRVVDTYSYADGKLTQTSHTELGNLGPNGETPTGIPVEPDGGIGDTPGETPIPVEPNGGIGDGTDGTAANAAMDKLKDITFQWTGSTYAGGTSSTPGDPSKYTVVFGADNHIAAQADCNQGGGVFTVDATTLRFEPIVSTLALCAEGSLSSEFLRDLEGVATYTLEDGVLTLTYADAGRVVKFKTAESGGDANMNDDLAKLQSVVWKWQGSAYKDGTKSTPADPSKYTIEFGTDNNAGIKADCNSGGGSYTLQGLALKFEPLISTLVACPEGSLGSEFMRDLQSVASFHFDGDTLVLDTADDGTMTFTK